MPYEGPIHLDLNPQAMALSAKARAREVRCVCDRSPASYAAERALAGRRSRRQRDLQARAERLARHWTRQQQGVRR